MLPGQMSPRQMDVKDGLRNLPFKFGQNLFNRVPGTKLKSLVKIGPVTAEILLTLSFRWWVVVVGGGGGGGVQSHFNV